MDCDTIIEALFQLCSSNLIVRKAYKYANFTTFNDLFWGVFVAKLAQDYFENVRNGLKSSFLEGDI